MRGISLTNRQARRFLLRRHGLIGEHMYSGKEGVLAYVGSCGSVQFDPIDVCGKNTDLVFQSRVKGFQKPMLDQLLYQKRALVDHFDKNLCIYPAEDWPYFAREREKYGQSIRSEAEVERARGEILRLLDERECVSARDAGLSEKVAWFWGDSTLARAALEAMYYRGELGIHHKEGSIKFYAPMERLLPGKLCAAPDPHPDARAYGAWRTLRRIGAVGLLWNRASDAWLCIDAHKGGGRAQAFDDLLAADKLIEVRVEGLSDSLYARASEAALLDEIASGAAYAPRTELIAPLDCLLWDRRLIRALFGFAYTWEIYTPEAKRQYGYYVLPLLCGEDFAGRVEAVADRREKMLRVKGVWWEEKPRKAELKKCLKRFAAFHGCGAVEGL